MKSKYRFFVAYPKDGEGETNAIINIVKKRLNIDYELWSYADVQDETEYYQEVVEPAIQDADFVLAFVGKQTEEDYLLNESIRLCNNLNKSMVPIKVGSGRIKEKNWGFRTKVVDFCDESQRISLLEQMHGWMGLTKIGDVYGSKVEILTNSPCVISRNDEVLGKTDKSGHFNCVLAKGSHDIIISSGDCWNKYRYMIPNNDSDMKFEASLKGVQQLKRYDYSKFLFDPSKETAPEWDLTHRSDFLLIASSEDKKKKDIIYKSFDNYYRSRLVPYPEFTPEEIVHSKELLIAVWIITAVLIFFAFGTGLLLIVSFFIVRNQKDKAIMRRNERRKRELISNTDNKNYNAWNEANRKMNTLLDIYRLPNVTLPNLGTPDNSLVPSIDW